jgi:hypothetical protein
MSYIRYYVAAATTAVAAGTVAGQNFQYATSLNFAARFCISDSDVALGRRVLFCRLSRSR